MFLIKTNLGGILTFFFFFFFRKVFQCEKDLVDQCQTPIPLKDTSNTSKHRLTLMLPSGAHSIWVTSSKFSIKARASVFPLFSTSILSIIFPKFYSVFRIYLSLRCIRFFFSTNNGQIAAPAHIPCKYASYTYIPPTPLACSHVANMTSFIP